MIGIHDRAGSFSDRWIEYCTERQIPLRRVNCLATDIVQQCAGLKALLWHWSHNNAEELLVARQIITALERMGLVVFPSIATCSHFDDKVAQKYLLEAIGAPLIPTWVFTSRVAAKNWIAGASWPKVFKLRCGAGSANVRLVRSQTEAKALCRQAFGRGFPAVSGYLTDLRTRLRKTNSKAAFWEKLRRAPRTLLKNLALQSQMPRQRDYIYFQEFLPGNAFDTRITIVGNRAFGFQRANRPNDFRASGSGKLVYDPAKLDKRCLAVAFEVADRIKSHSVAFDFLFSPQGHPKIGEISYCYMPQAVHACPGHWDSSLRWHEGHVWPQDAILEDLLSAVERQNKVKGNGVAFA